MRGEAGVDAVKLAIGQASAATIRDLAEWRYEPPYDFYNGDEEPVLNPERFFEARDEEGDLVGFYYFEWKDDALEYGLGLRPDRTGRGQGLDFFRVGPRVRARAVPAAAHHPRRGRVQRARCEGVRAGRVPCHRPSRATVRALGRGRVHRHGGAVNELLQLAPEVDEALKAGRAVVALETTLVAHGFPPGRGVEVGLESERRVRAAGAVPATVGVLDSRVRVGLSAEELERFTADSRKAGPRDLAACAVQGAVGATTVGGTLAVCRAAGIRFLGTGGLGGVHRGWQESPDVSADLAELVRGQTLVVSSGAKSLLDVAATTELLETLGIPVLGFRTDELPLFYAALGGPPASARVESATEAARESPPRMGARRRRAPGREPARGQPRRRRAADRGGALRGARRGVTGQAVTPFVLAFLHEQSGGRTLEANARLVADNAALAAEVAVAFAAL